MRIALAQLDPTVGDVAGNAQRAGAAVERARAAGADLLVLPELALIGYPPRDLLLRRGVVDACMRALDEVAAASRGMVTVIGTPRPAPGGRRGVRNSAAAVRDGAVVAMHDKILLPGYDVFDEDRYFDPGDAPSWFECAERRVGLLVCEDLWRGADVGGAGAGRYDAAPLDALVAAGCTLVVAPNASPFVIGKGARHLALVRERARTSGAAIAVVNQVGTNDDLVFDGRSMLVAPDGRGVRLAGFAEDLAVVDLAAPSAAPLDAAPADLADEDAETFAALRLAIHGYARKTGHERVLVGLSGGIDSALVATIAAAALGAEAVTGVMMPSRYSSPHSIADAEALAANLGLGALERIDLEPGHAALHGMLGAVEPRACRGLPDENLQARLRGVALMALANARGALLLATSNKSEMAAGYATLYGDMCGALALLGDLAKTRVWRLARWINAHHDAAGFPVPPIPVSSIEKAPSAELRPNQTDQDSLPPYEILDEIVSRLVDDDDDPADIARDLADRGTLPAAETLRWIRTIDRNEFKRFQAAIVPKLTPRAFGRGRPWPIVQA